MNILTREQYDNHDCHLSPEDSCTTCATWEEQCERCDYLRCADYGFHIYSCAFRTYDDVREEKRSEALVDMALGK